MSLALNVHPVELLIDAVLVILNCFVCVFWSGCLRLTTVIFPTSLVVLRANAFLGMNE